MSAQTHELTMRTRPQPSQPIFSGHTLIAALLWALAAVFGPSTSGARTQLKTLVSGNGRGADDEGQNDKEAAVPSCRRICRVQRNGCPVPCDHETTTYETTNNAICIPFQTPFQTECWVFTEPTISALML